MTVREFLYVDIERVRSMLAQLSEGVPESVTSRIEHSVEAEGGAKIAGIGGSAGYARQSGREESRSLQDLTFVLFERMATEASLINDLREDARSVDAWKSGSIHRTLSEGSLVSVTSDIQILDPAFFSARLTRFKEFADELVGLVVTDPSLNRQQLKQAQSRARKEMWGDTDPKTVEQIAALISSLLADSIAVRVFPCGREHPELSFGGVLLGRREYIQEEREALFGRYGSMLHGWTAVLQIAAIPTQSPAVTTDSLAELELTTSENVIRRAALESVAVDLIALLESVGFSEGPLWPSISTTPLAIYRNVPEA